MLMEYMLLLYMIKYIFNQDFKIYIPLCITQPILHLKFLETCL